jgi:predicted DNA-binding transcriptional regulator AlpA
MTVERAEMPKFDLVGLHEMAEMLAVSRQRADQLARQAGFPKPVADLKAGRIWRRADVRRWMRSTGRS